MNELIERFIDKFNELKDGSEIVLNRILSSKLEEKFKQYSEEVLFYALEKSGGRITIPQILDDVYLIKASAELSKSDPTKYSASQLREYTQEAFEKLFEEKKIASILESDVSKASQKILDTLKTDITNFVESRYGDIKREIVFVNPETKQELKEITHEAFGDALLYVQADEPLMLVGPAGTGKNYMCKQIADVLGLEFYFSNAVTQEYKITGFIDAHGKYHETQFYKAFTKGGLFMLDEIDGSIAEVLILLNAAIANRYFDFPIGRFDAHPDFRIVAAANTYGTGANTVYVGRTQLDGASLDRFAVLDIGYSPKIEDSLTDDKELLSFIRDFRRAITALDIRHIVSYRAISRIHKLKNHIPLNELVKSSLTKGLEDEDIKMILGKMRVVNKYVDAIRGYSDHAI